SAQAQQPETIATDRPGQAFNATTVGKHVFQLQWGSSFTRSQSSTPSGFFEETVNALASDLSVRVGLGERLEVNTTWIFNRNSGEFRGDDFDADISVTGVSASQVGARYTITNGSGALPAIGVQAALDLNLKAEEFENEGIAPLVLIATSQPLYKSLGLATNWGVTWDGSDASPNYNYVINLSQGLGDQWTVFIENYGSLAEKNDDDMDFDTFFDGGVAYLVNSNFQFDLFAGYANNAYGIRDFEDFFIAMGFSWRAGGTE
ncbi:MAG: hypothetical protein AAGB22_05810, partial [Bacteroidota bacterium]